MSKDVWIHFWRYPAWVCQVENGILEVVLDESSTTNKGVSSIEMELGRVGRFRLEGERQGSVHWNSGRAALVGKNFSIRSVTSVKKHSTDFSLSGPLCLANVNMFGMLTKPNQKPDDRRIQVKQYMQVYF